MPVTVTNGALTLTGDGTDIWNNADDFAFAYKSLTGDGSIVARVVSVGTGTNTWAKGGVMIRGDLTAGSADAYMVMTASSGNGASFQYRLTANGACANTDATAVLPVPYWVKLDRKGNLITGYVSADGKTWTAAGYVPDHLDDQSGRYRPVRLCPPGGRVSHDAVRQHHHDG